VADDGDAALTGSEEGSTANDKQHHAPSRHPAFSECIQLLSPASLLVLRSIRCLVGRLDTRLCHVGSWCTVTVDAGDAAINVTVIAIVAVTVIAIAGVIIIITIAVVVNTTIFHHG